MPLVLDELPVAVVLVLVLPDRAVELGGVIPGETAAGVEDGRQIKYSMHASANTATITRLRVIGGFLVCAGSGVVCSTTMVEGEEVTGRVVVGYGIVSCWER